MMQQFDLSNLVRCPAVDEEGFRCRLSPSHESAHEWQRCEWMEPDGTRCLMPPRHPGSHQFFWYDQHASLGDRRTIRYSGNRVEVKSLADRGERLAARRGWIELERRYEPGLVWRIPVVGAILGALAIPAGSMVVDYRFRTAEPPAADGPEDASA